MNQGTIPESAKPDKVINLSCFVIRIELFGPHARENGLTSYGGGTITSEGLHEEVDRNALDRIEKAEFDEHEAAVNAVESLVLAHAMGGIDVEAAAYECGIETVVDAIINNL